MEAQMLKLVMSIVQSVLNRFLQKLVHCDHKRKGCKLITKIPVGIHGLPVQFTSTTYLGNTQKLTLT